MIQKTKHLPKDFLFNSLICNFYQLHINFSTFCFLIFYGIVQNNKQCTYIYTMITC